MHLENCIPKIIVNKLPENKPYTWILEKTQESSERKLLPLLKVIFLNLDTKSMSFNNINRFTIIDVRKEHCDFIIKYSFYLNPQLKF